MNRKIVVRIVAILLALMLVLGVVISAVIALAEEAEINEYKLDITILESERAAHVDQTVEYVNNTGQHLDYVYFHLYANAYRRSMEAPFEDSEIDDAYPEGFNPGGVDFINVEVDGREAVWCVSGNEIYMQVFADIGPGETAEFVFEYYLLMPPASGRTGWGEMSWRLTDFYPVAAAYVGGDEAFALQPYGAVTAANYSDPANYSITIDAPETYDAAHTGRGEYIAASNGRRTLSIQAESARDVAIILSRKYYERSAEALGGTRVRAFTNTPTGASAALEAATSAIEVLTGLLGEFPLGSLDIAQTEYIGDSASYPGLIIISEDLLRLGRRGDLKDEIIRQIAAQWLIHSSGVNRASNAWLADTLCEYAVLMYYADTAGENEYLRRLNALSLQSLNITIPGSLRADSPLSLFTTRYDYDIIVIDRGAAVLHYLRKAMGAEEFKRALKLYATETRMKSTNLGDFISALDSVSGRSWGSFLSSLFYDINEYVGTELSRIE